MDYARHLQNTQRDQDHPAQRPNNAGGFSFVVDDWKRLERFLIIGSDGGTYYVSERKLTRDNAACVLRCLDLDGARTVNIITEISQAGRAPKNDPAIFALALAASHSNEGTRRVALSALPLVCRTGTHLFHFASACDAMRKWSGGLRNAISKWYTVPDVDRVALQAVKYQQRDGWSHKDILRLAHPETTDPTRQALFRWIVMGADGLGARDLVNTKRDQRRHYDALNLADLPKIVQGFELIKKASSAKVAAKLIADYKLPHECVPNEHKGDPRVWEALLPHMGLTAMMRNLGKMTNVSLCKPLSAATQHVIHSLTDKDRLKKERMHPLQLLVSQRVYAQGHGDKGKLTWETNEGIAHALNEAFYLSFDAVEPTGKAHLLALDVSGSMTCADIAGMPITPREASAAMAMVTARTEKNWHILGFSDRLVNVPIRPSMSLDQVVQVIEQIPMGGTDCSLPMLWAAQTKADVDMFAVWTDSETYAGRVHPHKALQAYRQKMGRPAKMAVIAMTASSFTIADPGDGGMLDCIGFDTATPAVLADFACNA